MLQFPSQSAMKELSQINKLMAYLKKNDEKIVCSAQGDFEKLTVFIAPNRI